MGVVVAVSQADMAVLRRVKEGLARLYGDRVERAVLFGSRARGDAKPDSDWDIAVFLRGDFDFWAEADRLGLIGNELMDAEGALVNARPFPEGGWNERTALMGEIRREGVDLSVDR